MKTNGSESERTINKGQTEQNPQAKLSDKHETSKQSKQVKSDELCSEDRTNEN